LTFKSPLPLTTVIRPALIAKRRAQEYSHLTPSGHSRRRRRFERRLAATGSFIQIARTKEILLPDQLASTCPACFEKIFSFSIHPNHNYTSRHLVPSEGRFAIVTDAGRDAVDVDALLTNGAEADGEVVWS